MDETEYRINEQNGENCSIVEDDAYGSTRLDFACLVANNDNLLAASANVVQSSKKYEKNKTRDKKRAAKKKKKIMESANQNDKYTCDVSVHDQTQDNSALATIR